MKYETEIHTSTCCHIRFPNEIKGQDREYCIDELNFVSREPSRLKDGITVSRDSLNEMDREGLPISFLELVDYLLNFQHADEYFFHC